MALIRFQLDLAIPEDVYNAIPAAKKIAARDAIRQLKALAVVVNAGQPNEEITVRADWHKCHHGETPALSCEPRQEI